MKEATTATKDLIINIITAAYLDNDTLNDTVIQDKRRAERIKELVTYSYHLCSTYGMVYLADDGQAAAMVLLPDTRRFKWRMLLWDLRLVYRVSGIRKALRALSRERALASVQKNRAIYHLYFIGTNPAQKGMGSGTALMKELITDCRNRQLPMYVEARVATTANWYQKFGFHVYHELTHAGRMWYCLRYDIDKGTT